VSIKKKIISAYVVVWLLFSLYGWLFGANSYRGFAYNLGSGLVWPVMIFPEFGKAISAVIIVIVIAAVLMFVRDTRK